MNVRETDKFLEGKAEGRIEGKEEGLLEAAISFMQKFNLTSEQAAIAIGVPLTKLQEALKKAEVR